MSAHAVLVIADDPLIRKILHSLLGFGAYRALECTDLENGVRLARECRPDCILLDLSLPSMDPAAAARSLRKSSRGAPVVALTASDLGPDGHAGLNGTFDGYITKPIDTRSFLATIGGILRAAESGCGRARQRAPCLRVCVGTPDKREAARIGQALGSAGYEVSTADTGEALLEQAVLGGPDLLLVDTELSQPDGFETVRRLKDIRSTVDVPVVLTCAERSDTLWTKALEAGADGLLARPVDPPELIALARSVAQRKQFGEKLATLPQAEMSSALLTGSWPVPEPTPPLLAIVGKTVEDIESLEQALGDRRWRLTSARTEAEALALVTRQAVDIVVQKIARADPASLGFCRLVKAQEPGCTVQLIVLCPGDDLHGRVAALREGADDCLTVPYDAAELSARVTLLSRRKARFDSLLARYTCALSAATTDRLTGLHNGATLRWLLDLEVKRSVRHSQPLSLILLDVDNLGRGNLNMGYLAGDLVLAEMAEILKYEGRETDLVARYGGDEFAMALPHTDFRGACRVAERVRAAVGRRSFLLGRLPPGSTTVSVGVSSLPTDAMSFVDLLQSADARLARAKLAGKDRVCVVDDRVAACT
jgi:two-component system, cell cycle response regulator